MRSEPTQARPLGARTVLRTATQASHDRVDSAFGRCDLATPYGYRAFLTAQAAAFLPIEAALDAADAARVIPDWPERRRAALLVADLADLGAPLPEPVETPVFGDAARIAGAIYVLEGSRLGGAMLHRSVAPGMPTRFLATPTRPDAWRSFLLALDTILNTPDRLDAATEAAIAVFTCFEHAARHMEPPHGR